MNQGKFFGVGVGSGDPALVTIGAMQTIADTEVLMLPAKDREDCRAYRIVSKACEAFGDLLSVFDLAKKECIFEPFPMLTDASEREEFHKSVAGKIANMLDAGKNVAFLTIGDPTVYATYGYVADILRQGGYETRIVSGVPSFCAAAGRLGIALGSGNEEIHIIPGNADLHEAILQSGTKVFMKTGKKLGALKEELRRLSGQKAFQVYAVTNCGEENEEIATGIDQIPDDWGYMSIIIVKETEEGSENGK